MYTTGETEPAFQRRTNTWSSSDQGPGLERDQDVVDSRKIYLDEYNRLSRKYGIRPLVPNDFLPRSARSSSLPQRKVSWLTRALVTNLATASVAAGHIAESAPRIRRHRSVGDFVAGLVPSTKRPPPKTNDLSSLVKLCGKSLFYLPVDFATRPLVLPTCLRATAQMILQQAHTRGIFRASGSARVVNTLYNYYHDHNWDETQVSSTTRCPSLPSHISFNIHDIASVFKRFLADLPGGILGSLPVFDALVAIYSQLEAEPELTKTKKTRLRARLTALALSTVQSHYQRDLIIAVFGLLSFIGRQAEVTSHEDVEGRPLPTTDLMGYNKLGIVFGPLLIGNLLTDYSMRVADPASGLILFAITPPRSKKKAPKHKLASSHQSAEALSLTVDKVHIANQIVEMLVTHWRDIIRQWRLVDTQIAERSQMGSMQMTRPHTLRSSMTQPLIESEDSRFHIRQPHSWQHRAASDLADLSPRDDLEDTENENHLKSFVRGHIAQSNPASTTGKAMTPRRPVWTARRMLSPPLENSTEASPALSHRRGNSTPSPKDIGASSVNYQTLESPSSIRPDHTKSKLTDLDEASMVSEMTIHKFPVKVGIKPIVEFHQESQAENGFSDEIVRSSFGEVNGDRSFHGQYKHNSKPTLTPRDRYKLSRSPILRDSNEDSKGAESEAKPNSQDAWNHTRLFPEASAIASSKDEMYQANSSSSKMIGGQRPYFDEQPGWSMEEFERLNLDLNATQDASTSDIDSPGYHSALYVETTLHPQACSLLHRSNEHNGASMAGQAASALSDTTKPQATTPKGISSHEKPPATDQRFVVAAPETPPWMRLLLHKRSEQRRKPRTLSAERRNMFESIPNPTPIKGRASSKQSAQSPGLTGSMEDVKAAESPQAAWTPISGGVKTMAALFEQQTKRLRQSQSAQYSTAMPAIESGPSDVLALGSTIKKRGSATTTLGLTPAGVELSKPQTPSPKTTARSVLYAPTTQTIPRSSSKHELTRVIAARNAPKDLFDSSSAYRPRLLSRPPSLGSMPRGSDEPPVAQHLNFARPTSTYGGGSQNGEDIGNGGGDAHRLLAASPRLTSSTSLLHDRIRSLQGQLATRDEELAQMRRLLETREDIDIGTLCEQLRQAKRECKLWRERAEAAERRVAAFERLTARIRQLKDGNMAETTAQETAVGQHDGALPGIKDMIRPQGRQFLGSSHRSDSTEDLNSFQGRIRNYMLGGVEASAFSNWDGEVFD